MIKFHEKIQLLSGSFKVLFVEIHMRARERVYVLYKYTVSNCEWYIR